MALIKCPECGKEISDKAKACINCGFPIETLSDSGVVKIRVNPLRGIINGEQKVYIFLCEPFCEDSPISSVATPDVIFMQNTNGETLIATQTLWEGKVGDTAEIHFNEETDVIIQYRLSWMHWEGRCCSKINPTKNKKYVVSPRQGVFTTKLVLQPVDLFICD